MRGVHNFAHPSLCYVCTEAKVMVGFRKGQIVHLFSYNVHTKGDTRIIRIEEKERIIFCDARATDAGYMAPEDIAGRVEVTGRCGTVLQPGVDALIRADDFPQKGPILIITDGEIEDNLHIGREHAFLLPKGCRLPFRAKGSVFHFGDGGSK